MSLDMEVARDTPRDFINQIPDEIIQAIFEFIAQLEDHYLYYDLSNRIPTYDNRAILPALQAVSLT